MVFLELEKCLCKWWKVLVTSMLSCVVETIKKRAEICLKEPHMVVGLPGHATH
jgi:hypothetical protein